MRCRDARTALSARLDSALDPRLSAQLDAHLVTCAGCRAEAARYQQLRTQLRLSEPIATDLVPALRERLSVLGAPVALDRARERARAHALRRRSRVLIAVVAAALIVAVVFARGSTLHVELSPATPSGSERLAPPHGESLLLAWTSTGLPNGALSGVRTLVGVDAVTEVRGDDLRLTGTHDANGRSRLSLPRDAQIPIDALAVDPSGYARNLPADAARLVRALPRDGAILGATSARLRGIGVGGTLTFGTTTARATTVRVTGVLDDSLVGAAEVVVRTDSVLAVPTPRFLLIAYHGDRAELEVAVHDRWHRPVRFRGPGETPYLRYGDAVLPQALVKARFGEFWYRFVDQRHVSIDPQWIARNIVTVDLPGIGRIACHRLVADDLRRAFADLAVATPTAAVAYQPQFIGFGLGLSRHTWGIGLSWRGASAAGSKAIDRLDQAGFRWGGRWLNPSPNYFEWVGKPNG
jgi:hypothetical protein